MPRMYIEQSGDHVFRPDLVPVAFSVDWVYDQTDYVFDPVAVYNAAWPRKRPESRLSRTPWERSQPIADLIFGRNYIVSNNAWFEQFNRH